MKFIYKIILWLSGLMLVFLTAWGIFFFRAMEAEINDETDDMLENYSADIIMKWLSGVEIPSIDNGSNNTYYIRKVSPEYAASVPSISYENAMIFIASKDEDEAARIRHHIFMDEDDSYYELTVAVPTFEKEDIQRSILWWIVALYIAMLLSVLFISVLVIGYNMRPLKAMLRWLDDYVPGKQMPPVPSGANVTEFRQLSETISHAAERFEVRYQEQKRFIGNASHELQTPLASCSNRIEMLLDSPDLTEAQARELVKVHRELQGLISLNRTLLLLTRIENGQFPETVTVDFSSVLKASEEMFSEIYAGRGVTVVSDVKAPFLFRMNEQLAAILVRTLLKNAFLHSPAGSEVSVRMDRRGFCVSNPGDAPLDSGRIFTRFYHSQSPAEGSTGLGLAIVSSICRNYGLSVEYRFEAGRHVFSIKTDKKHHNF